MNHYGELVRRHWEQRSPSRMPEPDDPDRYFERLGDAAEERVAVLYRRLAAERASHLHPSDHLAELVALRAEAERLVLDELLPPR